MSYPNIHKLYEYETLGRLASVGRAGQTMTALQQNYSYNIRSWLTGISGDLFTEVIRHEDSSTPRWGGKISETSWRNPGETSDRGYRYSYDSLSRLTAAEYADASGSGLFTERYGYDLNGNMTSRTKAVQLTDSSGNTTPANLLARNSYTGKELETETGLYDFRANNDDFPARKPHRGVSR